MEQTSAHPVEVAAESAMLKKSGLVLMQRREDVGQAVPHMMPRFELKPEGFFDRIGSVLGGHDIDFAEDPEFSRACRLKGPDEPAIRETFHAGLAISGVPRVNTRTASRTAKMNNVGIANLQKRSMYIKPK